MDEQSRQRVGQRLAGLFGDRLRERFGWVTSFNVDPERHNDYYLLFGTDHKDGLREMKRGMWKVDKHAGEGFKQAKTLPDQEQLFSDDAVVVPPDTSILRWFAAGRVRRRACSRSQKPRTSRFAARGIWTRRTCGNGRYAHLSRRAISQWSSPRGVEKATTRRARRMRFTR